MAIKSLLFIATLGFVMAGCGGSGNSTPNPFQGNYVGTYTSPQAAGVTGNVSMTITASGSLSGNASDTVAGQGTFSGTISNSGQMSGTFTYPQGNNPFTGSGTLVNATFSGTLNETVKGQAVQINFTTRVDNPT